MSWLVELTPRGLTWDAVVSFLVLVGGAYTAAIMYECPAGASNSAVAWLLSGPHVRLMALSVSASTRR